MSSEKLFDLKFCQILSEIFVEYNEISLRENLFFSGHHGYLMKIVVNKITTLTIKRVFVILYVFPKPLLLTLSNLDVLCEHQWLAGLVGSVVEVMVSLKALILMCISWRYRNSREDTVIFSYKRDQLYML